MEYDIPYPTYIPYIGPNNAPLGVKCQGRVVTCFNSTYFYTYLDAKYVKKCTSWRTLKMNNPMGLLSWDPLASSYDYGGQNLIHSAYEAR